MRSALISVVLPTALVIAGCASRTPALTSLVGRLGVDVQRDTRTLLAAHRECHAEEVAGRGNDSLVACINVAAELATRRRDREYELYDGKVDGGIRSCAEAARLVAVVASLDGPIAMADGVVMPPLSDLASPRGRQDEAEGRDGALTDHAIALLRCDDGPALGVVLEQHAAFLSRRAARGVPVTAAERVARAFPRAAFAMADRGTAPDRLKAALASAPRPPRCPTTPDAVLAALRSSPAGARRSIASESGSRPPTTRRRRRGRRRGRGPTSRTRRPSSG